MASIDLRDAYLHGQISRIDGTVNLLLGNQPMSIRVSPRPVNLLHTSSTMGGVAFAAPATVHLRSLEST